MVSKKKANATWEQHSVFHLFCFVFVRFRVISRVVILFFTRV